MALCDERLSLERGQFEKYKQNFENLTRGHDNIEDKWERLNAELRSMGLPTLPLPEGED